MRVPAARWKLRLQVPAAAADLFSSALRPYAPAVASFGSTADGLWTVEAYTVRRPDPARLGPSLRVAAAAAGIDEPPLCCEPLPQRDWLAENLESFQPVRAGRFIIHPSHCVGPPPAGSIAIEIDAATAFGSGGHGSTYGCLLAIDRLAPSLGSEMSALDLGCGSGILAIAIAKLGCRRVVAADIDPEAVRVCRANLHGNAVAGRVRAIRADGLRDRRLRSEGQFRIIVANILAGPLMILARDIEANLRADGRVVLSGLLPRQEPMVLGAYRRCGLVLESRITVAGWRTLILRR